MHRPARRGLVWQGSVWRGVIIKMKKYKDINSTDELKGIKKVRLKADKLIYYIYTIYDKTHLSLCIYSYNDAEQDFQTNVNEIEILK